MHHILKGMRFAIQKRMKNTLGRAGALETAHGVIETPAFVAVGTKATVKALTSEQIKEIGVPVVFGNTYHLYLEPGETVIKKAGGLGKFMGWSGPTMTDSGGFQVFSLGAAYGKTERSKIATHLQHTNKLENVGMLSEGVLAKIDEGGVTFKSYKDGSTHRFTPERSIEIQHAIGADIIFAFDECTSPEAPLQYQREAMERTHRWAERSLREHRRLFSNSHELENKDTQTLFGIVQGGRFEKLRKESARVIGKMELVQPDGSRCGFDGFGIGGSFEKEDIDTVLDWVNSILPEEKPRHLLGIGEPLDLFGAVENGCDLFDCVAPTRRARNGSLYTSRGLIAIENARYKNDFTPIETSCGCYTCKHFTRAYLSHLFRSKEILSNTLASIHNLYFIIHLVRRIQETILEGNFARFKEDFLSGYQG
ncbi:MAG: queuine tRNA-ribosyltransferase [Parcubacteria group bacterium Greene0416_79]|nr:MAG: queuine tRNA-ribosyltransferase [Parcubacteria group bacterium Greene0416_79]